MTVTHHHLLTALVAGTFIVSGLWASSPGHGEPHAHHSPEAERFVHGAPDDASEAWTLAAGGRIYDNWWEALNPKAPTRPIPSR